MAGVPDDDKLGALRVSIAATTTSVMATIAAGGSPGTAVAGAAAQIAVQSAVAVRQRWTAKATRAIEIAADALDVGVDIVLQRASTYDDRLELLARVIEASARSTIPEKVTALGLVLADGLGDDDADTAEALVLARALEVLEAPHVVVLDYIGDHPQPSPSKLHPALLGAVGWQVHLLNDELPAVAKVMDPVVAALSGAGLLYDVTGASYGSAPGPACWTITKTGRRCLGLLDAHVDDPTASA